MKADSIYIPPTQPVVSKQITHEASQELDQIQETQQEHNQSSFFDPKFADFNFSREEPVFQKQVEAPLFSSKSDFRQQLAQKLSSRDYTSRQKTNRNQDLEIIKSQEIFQEAPASKQEDMPIRTSTVKDGYHLKNHKQLFQQASEFKVKPRRPAPAVPDFRPSNQTARSNLSSRQSPVRKSRVPK